MNNREFEEDNGIFSGNWFSIVRTKARFRLKFTLEDRGGNEIGHNTVEFHIPAKFSITSFNNNNEPVLIISPCREDDINMCHQVSDSEGNILASMGMGEKRRATHMGVYSDGLEILKAYPVAGTLDINLEDEHGKIVATGKRGIERKKRTWMEVAMSDDAEFDHRVIAAAMIFMDLRTGGASAG